MERATGLSRSRKQHSGRKDTSQVKPHISDLWKAGLCIYEVCVICIGNVWDASGAYMVHVYYYIIDYEVYSLCGVYDMACMRCTDFIWKLDRMYGVCSVRCICGVCIMCV